MNSTPETSCATDIWAKRQGHDSDGYAWSAGRDSYLCRDEADVEVPTKMMKATRGGETKRIYRNVILYTKDKQ